MRLRATRLGVVNQNVGGYTAIDSDARTYIAAVEAADGQPLENSVKQALDLLFAGLKTDSIFTAISQSVLLAGPRTVAGGMVPFTGTGGTAANFVAGDINRRTGWAGDAATKWVNLNRAGNIDAQDNRSMGCWVSTVSSNMAHNYMGDTVVSGGSILAPGTTSGISSRFTTASATNTNSVNVAGLIGVSRSAAGSYTLRANASDTVISVASTTPSSVATGIFCRGAGASAFTDARIAFAWRGSAFTQSLLEARLQTYLNALAAAGI